MQKTILEFMEWTKLKIKIHLSERSIYFWEREIWWTSLGVNIGYEQDGKHKNFERPILIIKRFNRDILWALPITSKDKKGEFYYKFCFKNQNYCVILSQIRLINSKRLLRKIGMISKEDFKQIKQDIKNFL